jgi:hypothetical protein
VGSEAVTGRHPRARRSRHRSRPRSRDGTPPEIPAFAPAVAVPIAGRLARRNDMTWIPLTKLQVVGCVIAVVLGAAIIVLWLKTHHLDPRHGAMHMLLGGISLVGAGVGLLAAEAHDRFGKRR